MDFKEPNDINSIGAAIIAVVRMVASACHAAGVAAMRTVKSVCYSITDAVSAALKKVGSACQMLYERVKNCLSEFLAKLRKFMSIASELFKRQNTATSPENKSPTNNDLMVVKYEEDFTKGFNEDEVKRWESMGGCMQFVEAALIPFLKEMEKLLEELLNAMPN